MCTTREEYVAKYGDNPQTERMCHPNNMMYSDQHGVKHEIYIPARDYYKAHNHLINQEWDELAKFPKYTGQGYTEADFFTAETDPKTFYSVQPPADDEEPKEKEAQEKK